ncbi:MAG: RluA family pseudouridine synthase [Verrucomicrobiaceae bacterium]|nr:RluA family pseudouridine synthase [Verrucomicrobiaceae bacterium]
MNFEVSATDTGMDRLDRYLQLQLPEMSRSRLQDLIKEGLVLVNDKKIKPSAELRAGDKISLTIPEPVSTEVVAQDIPIDVLYEDADLIVINKASGIVVHPAAGNPDGTLVNALLHHCDDLSGIGGEVRPGIVHRLDKDTSGCMVVAKHDRSHALLAEQFAHRRISKLYLAAVNGIPKERSGRIENMIGRHPVDRKRMAVLFDGTGKNAVTEWKMLCEAQGCALILNTLLTGRTHQIRVHMRDVLQCPILGDSLYGHPPKQKVKVARLMLHAWRLAFDHPITLKRMEFKAAIPDDFRPWLAQTSLE